MTVVLGLNVALIPALAITGVTAHSVAVLLKGTPHVRGLAVLSVSAIAAVLMLVGPLMLSQDGEDERDLNMRAVLLDTAADAAPAAGVTVSGAVVYLTGGWHWLDPSVALLIAVVVGYRTIALLRDVVGALRDTSGPLR